MPKGMSGVANGVEGVREQVRYNVKNGADVIKFGASAGVLSEEESVGAPQYTQEEMNAIVSEAKMWGRKTAAHAHGTEAIKMAVKAGVASVEHGSFLDAEGIQLMKERGTYLVADVYDDEYIIAEYAKLGYPEKIINKENLLAQGVTLLMQQGYHGTGLKEILDAVQIQPRRCSSNCQRMTRTQTEPEVYLLWQKTACSWQSIELDCPLSGTPPTWNRPSGCRTNHARQWNVARCRKRRMACPIARARSQAKPCHHFGAL